MAKRGVVSLGPGHEARTMDMVERLRRFRGRSTVWEMIIAMGGQNGSPTAYNMVMRLCRDYQIAYKKAPMGIGNGKEQNFRDYDREAAAQNLKREIDEARQEAPTAPLFKAGGLEW